MSWLNVANFIWLSASLILFGLTLFPLYARTEPKRARELMPHVAIVVLIAALAAVLLHTQIIGASWVEMATTGIGRIWLTQIVIAALTYFATIRRPAALVALLAGAELVGFAFVGHANAISGTSGALIETAHVLAAGGWIGGVIALWFALREPNAVAAVARFSWMGMIFVAVIGVTGVIVHLNNTGALLPVTGMRYGQLTTAKIVLFAAALGCAGFNRLVATPRADWHTMARVIAGELALLFVIVAAAVWLAQTEPYG